MCAAANHGGICPFENLIRNTVFFRQPRSNDNIYACIFLPLPAKHVLEA
jgi:hypothetical protein